VRAVVHLARPARWVADYHPVDAVEEIGDGRLAVHLRLEDPRWLVRLALRLAPDVRVVEPPALAAEVEATARRALALHVPAQPADADAGPEDAGRA
jgi:proteasome accessory factor C